MLDKRLFNLVWQPTLVRFAFLLCLLLVSFGGVTVVVQAFLLSRIIQGVFLNHQSLTQVSQELIWLLECIMFRFLLSLAKDYFAEVYTRQSKTQLREKVLSALLVLGPYNVAQGRVGEMVNTVVEGIEAIDPYLREWLPQLWSAAVYPLIIIFIVLGYDWLSALIFAVTAPLIPLFMVLIGKAVSNLTEKQWNALSRMSAVYLELLQALNMLKVFNRSRQQVHFITAVGEEHEQATMKVLRVAFLSALSLELLSTISTAVVAVGVGLRLLYGFMEFEDALFVLFLAPELYLPLRQLGSKFHSATNGVSAANRIFDVLSKPSPMYQGDAVPYEPLEKICFRQVNFSFHQNTRATLKDISFEMKPRQLTALVGPSGAGKSTLTAILLGFLQPSSGEVTYNDIPLSKLDMEWWRSKVSWVAQSPYLFDGTIIENIRLAVPQASLQEIINAAELAHAHEFIQSMPQGYETIVGERGVRLSVGEAQRLALARAFLKKDSFLLVVDEPTSALDVESEQYIQEALSRLAKERSVLVLAHRLATVVKADQIIVLSNGSVVQRGTHEKLLEEEGVYRELVNASSHAEVLMEEPTLDSLGLDTEQYHADSTQLNIPLSLNFEEKSDTSTGLWVQKNSVINAIQHWVMSLPMIQQISNLKIRQLNQLIALHAELILPISWSILVGSLTVLSGISLMSAAAFIISAAALHPSIADLNVAIVGVRFFGISRGVFRYIERLISHQATLKLLTRLRAWFYSVLEPLVPAQLQMKRSADIYETINADISSLDQFYLRVSFPPLVALLVVAALSVFFMVYAKPLIIILWLAIICAAIITPLGVYRLSRSIGRSILSLRRELTSTTVEFLQGCAELLIFQAERQWLAKLKAIQQSWSEAQTKMALINAFQAGLTNLWANLAIWAALCVLIPMVNQQMIPGVLLAVLIMALLSSFEAITPLPQAAQFLEANRESAERLIEIAKMTPKIVDPIQAVNISPLQEVVFRHVSFRYDEKEPDVLEDISFFLTRGKKLAVVGHSGAGKSSLVNLLLRFWDVQEGELLWNGIPLECYSQEDLRNQLSVLHQRFTLFNMPILDHFRLANPQVEKEEVVRVCKAVGIHERILTLPSGYETIIGERGSFLSAGERQRIGLAMALLKPASLLVLDEPTAHLDTLTEKAVLTSIQSLINHKAVLWITHRLVGLENMDEIIVLRKGRIVERGNHRQLLAKAGEYQRMLAFQSIYLDERNVRTS